MSAVSSRGEGIGSETTRAKNAKDAKFEKMLFLNAKNAQV
jgi:hypothetical protein